MRVVSVFSSDAQKIGFLGCCGGQISGSFLSQCVASIKDIYKNPGFVATVVTVGKFSQRLIVFLFQFYFA